MTTPVSHQEKLNKLARLAVKKGAALQPGQPVMISANIANADLVREIVNEAWKAGASNVEVNWRDDAIDKAFYQYADDETIGSLPAWKASQLNDAAAENTAFIHVDGDDPDGLSDVDPARLMARSIARNKAAHQYREGMDTGKLAWTIVPAAHPRWAQKVYPELSEAEAAARLWEDLFAVCRIDENDPLENWAEHEATFIRRMNKLKNADIVKYHYTSSNGTDLWVETIPGVHFEGGASTLADGRRIHCNIPTEEVFTTPKKTGVNGTLNAVMPLSFHGQLIEDFGFTFKDGKVIDFHAATGREALKALLESDENAPYLGEMALVDKRTPIRRMNKLFFNTLLDENASCHFAFGQSYAETMENGFEKSEEELEEAGMNQSRVHVDFMVGADDLNIEGWTSQGERIPVFESGQFSAWFDQ